MKIYGKDLKNAERLGKWEEKRRPRRPGDYFINENGLIEVLVFMLAFWIFIIGLFGMSLEPAEIWPNFAAIGGLAVMALAAWRLMQAWR